MSDQEWSLDLEPLRASVADAKKGFGAVIADMIEQELRNVREGRRRPTPKCRPLGYASSPLRRRPRRRR